MNPHKITVRTALMPICYMDFHCLAAACHDNCCGGWTIAFNKKDYLRVKGAAKSGELEEILARGMSRFRENATEERYAYFCAAREERCALQTEEGLCRLQMECGEEVLLEVCRIYPRGECYTAAGKEFCLSPSCEGVLAQLWDLPQGIDFWEEPLPKQEWRVIQAPPRKARFADIRSFCIDVLQERTLPLFQRMQLLGVLIQRLKDVDWTREGVVDDWLIQGESLLHSLAANSMLEHLPKNQLGFLTTNLRILLGLYQEDTESVNIYRTLFSAVSAEANWEEKGLDKFTIDSIRYQELENRLVGLLGHSDYFFENLMVMVAFYIKVPDLQGAEELWRSYVCLCALYSFYWFAAVCGCAQENSCQRLFQVLGRVSRSLLHNSGRRDQLLNMLLERDSGTLANMAVLAGGIAAFG